MGGGSSRVAEGARVALAAIRLVNGTAALAAPEAMARRIGVDPGANRPALYVMRLFGARTVLIGAQLLQRDAGVREAAVRAAPFIHVSDALAAVLAGAGRQLPRRAAATAAAISTANVALALLAQRRARAG